MDDTTWLPGTFLGRLDKTARDRLLAVGIRRSVKESQVVLQEGALESHVILLDDALAKVTVEMADGRQALLAIRMSGDIVGEISALNGTPRTATVTACRPSIVRIVHHNAFRAFLRSNPDAAMEARPRRCSGLRCSVQVEDRAGLELWDERDSDDL
ncbi:cyclic nucleotide-binding domain-containing protein, partial [Micromonospora sp. NPDC050200]|uniref:Crp/Fnr family transcriptional regulator n=1 Tax=Micromonospora sp. NPDC050200 TaxID=3155664 RepID=UPI0033F135E3